MSAIIRPKTTVVNVKHEEYDVYIGRAMPGYAQSEFHNMVRLRPGMSREECLALLRVEWEKTPQIYDRMRAQLLGRRIGCWCAPQLCHGHLIVELIEGISVEDQLALKKPQLNLF